MQYFNFFRLIKKYSSEFTAITLENGYYDDTGDWINGDTVKTVLTGAIISHKESRIFRSEGTLTEKDKRLFTLSPIDNKLIGAKLIHDGNIYGLLDCSENATFTGVYAYTLKYVSAFKDVAPDYDLTTDLERLAKRLDGVLINSSEQVSNTKTDESLKSLLTLCLERLDGEST